MFKSSLAIPEANVGLQDLILSFYIFCIVIIHQFNGCPIYVDSKSKYGLQDLELLSGISSLRYLDLAFKNYVKPVVYDTRYYKSKNGNDKYLFSNHP